MRVRKLLLFLICIFCTVSIARGQTYNFRHYDVASGLSHNTVQDIVQDSLGFMWFGTRDGVNRFDGSQFKVYRFANSPTESSGNNWVHVLHLDESGTLLAATEKEVYKYDPIQDAFSFVFTSTYYSFDELATDKQGRIWMLAGFVISRCDKQGKQLKVFDPNKNFYASSIQVDKNGTFWAVTTEGVLMQYNEKADTFRAYDLFAHSKSRNPAWVDRIQCTRDGKILIGSQKGGFKIFDVAQGDYTDIPLCCEKPEHLFIRCFLQVSPSEIWIGTRVGVFIYNPQTGQSKVLQRNSSDPSGISDNSIYGFCRDKEGGIWLGTLHQGINYLPRPLWPFQRMFHQPGRNSLSGNIVKEITEDHLGNYWIGTEDAGLNKIDAQTGEFIHFLPDVPGSSVSNICINNLLIDGDELWAGTLENGIDIIDIRTGKNKRRYTGNPKTGLKSSTTSCLQKTPSGAILAGTTIGVYRYDKSKDYFEPIEGLPLRDWYLYVFEDSKGNIWTSNSNKGIYRLDKQTGKVDNFAYSPKDPSAIASNKTNAIFEDSKHRLWFATENGLCRWNPDTHNFKRYGTKQGFPSPFIVALQEDERGRLWVTTTQGLVCFDPEKENSLVYTTDNGLLSDQFNIASAFKDSKGRMYFGSASGLISFNPNALGQDSVVPRIYLTGMQIDNQEIKVNADESPLTRSLVYTDKITLSHDQSTFGLDFAALGYTAPGNLQFAYQLEGLSDNWIQLKGRRVNFTKLAAGHYTLKLKASSTSGLWNDQQTVLSITVLPPWWASLWAYLAYVLIAILLGWWLLHQYHLRVEEKNQRKIERLEIAQEKELLEVEIAKEKESLDSKIAFFTNVAHEIRTPLTLIKIPLAKVIRKTSGNQEVEKSLDIIKRNTDRLVQLTGQLLNFQQTEISAFKLSYSWANISELLCNTHQNFEGLIEQNAISVTLTLPEQPLYADIDVDAFSKILYNLFGNAVKYADKQVDIHLESNGDQFFRVIVQNDGFLIPEQLAEKIFEPFYRIKETETKGGTGIGLALSRSLTKLHNGTLELVFAENSKNVFILTLPIHQAAATPDTGETTN